MFSAVIYTPGRTGSKLIERNLIDHFSSLHRSWQNKKLFDSGIVHCHNPLYVPPNKNFICIISTRRNEFDAILSMITTKQTKEFATYTNKTIEPFEVSETEFKSMFYYYTCFYEIINRSFFDSVVEMEYESLISNPKYLFSKLGIDHVTNYKKIYVKGKVVWFNAMDIHGGDPLEHFSWSLRIDGIFKDEFKEIIRRKVRGQ